MNIFSIFFREIFFRPLLNLLVFFYNLSPVEKLGLAIILLTVLVRLVLLPLTIKLTKQQRLMSAAQKDVEAIKEKYKSNKEEGAKKVIELYKERKIKPFSQFWILAVQVIVLIALFSVFNKGLKPGAIQGLYSFVASPEVLKTTFLGFVDLAKKSIPLALLVGISQFFQAKVSLKKTVPPQGPTKTPDFSHIMQRQTLYVFPLVTFFISSTLPAGILLYWVVSNIISIIQDVLIKYKSS